MPLASSMDVPVVIISCLALAAFFFGVWWTGRRKREKAERLRREQAEARAQELWVKYGSAELVGRLLGREYWQGQTAEQLRDSLGPPHDIDERVMKTRTRETWKYGHRGGNRYVLRVVLEDGVVVGWTERD